MNKVALGLFALLLMACKPIALSDASSITFAPALTMTVYEYNAHRTKIDPLFLCQEAFCQSVQVINPIKTKEVFHQMGWTEPVLLSFLQDESYKHYKDQDQFHLMLFFFQSKGVDYLRVVNAFTKTVSTIKMPANQVAKLGQILQAQNLVYIASKPSLADIYINERLLGEAPLWVSLEQGSFDLVCKLPGFSGDKMTLTIPGPLQHTCPVRPSP
ncbi:MAG: PEGA domain-containing protein [Deltaproteobacteria bacterium]|nr:PEGA domain-containing protein [Deltaproteobacteria bacterium]